MDSKKILPFQFAACLLVSLTVLNLTTLREESAVLAQASSSVNFQDLYSNTFLPVPDLKTASFTDENKKSPAARTSAKQNSVASELNPDGTVNNEYWGIQPEGRFLSSDKELTREEIARNNTESFNNLLKWASEAPGILQKDELGRVILVLEEGMEYLVDGQHKRIYSVSDKSIELPSNISLDLNSSTFRQIKNSQQGYAVFVMIGIQNTKIHNGALIGDKDIHDYAGKSREITHEYGFGIDIRGCGSIEVRGLNIYNMTGDSILVGGKDTYLSDGGAISTNITINNCQLHDNRRQGITVMGGKNINIHDNQIYNIGKDNGTAPMFGIDLENELDWPIESAMIYQNTFYNNQIGDIMVHRGTIDTEINNNQINRIYVVYGENTVIQHNRVTDGGIYSVDTSEPIKTIIDNNELINANIEVVCNFSAIVTNNNIVDGNMKFNYSTGAVYNNSLTNKGGKKKFGIQVYADPSVPEHEYEVYFAKNKVDGNYNQEYNISDSRLLSVHYGVEDTEEYLNDFSDMEFIYDSSVPLADFRSIIERHERQKIYLSMLFVALVLTVLAATAFIAKKSRKQNGHF